MTVLRFRGEQAVTYHIPIPPERGGMELDEFLCLTFPLLNKGYLRRQVREGRVLVDGNPAVRCVLPPSRDVKNPNVGRGPSRP